LFFASFFVRVDAGQMKMAKWTFDTFVIVPFSAAFVLVFLARVGAQDPTPKTPVFDQYSRNCSNFCSQQDDDSVCWSKTLDYYNDQLVSIAKNWIIVQIDIDQWKRRHEKSTTFDYDGTFNSSVAGLGKFTDDKYVVSSMIQPLAKILVDQVNATSQAQMLAPPAFFCPLPCNYGSQMWLYLFIASLCVNLALILAVIPFVIRTEKRDRANSPLLKRAKNSPRRED